MGIMLLFAAPLLPIIFPFFLVISSGKLLFSSVANFVKKFAEFFRG